MSIKNMSLNDWFAFLFALYGAVLSTILAIREIRKETRRIAIFLMHNVWQDAYSITITNNGHRPITLVDLQISIPNHGDIPKNSLMPDSSNGKPRMAIASHLI